jgi:hypothetical protein
MVYKRPDDVRHWQPGAKEAVPNFSVKLMQKIKNIESEGYHSFLFVLILTSLKILMFC